MNKSEIKNVLQADRNASYRTRSVQGNVLFLIDDQKIQEVSQSTQISTTSDITAGRIISNFLTNRDQATRPNSITYLNISQPRFL